MSQWENNMPRLNSNSNVIAAFKELLPQLTYDQVKVLTEIGYEVMMDNPMDRYHELAAMPGMQEFSRIIYAAELLRLQRCLLDPICNPGLAATIARKAIGELHREETILITIDGSGTAISVVRLYVGTQHKQSVRVAEILRPAVVDNAAAFILAHTHPSGILEASESDTQVIEALAIAAAAIDIEFWDFIVCATRSTEYFSAAAHYDALIYPFSFNDIYRPKS